MMAAMWDLNAGKLRMYDDYYLLQPNELNVMLD